MCSLVRELPCINWELRLISYGITHYKICQLVSKLVLGNFVPASGFRKVNKTY